MSHTFKFSRYDHTIDSNAYKCPHPPVIIDPRTNEQVPFVCVTSTNCEECEHHGSHDYSGSDYIVVCNHPNYNKKPIDEINVVSFI